MYNLNLLSILLILIAFFVFYNEFNKKLHFCEMLLLAIAFVAILRGSYNYIQLENQVGNNQNTYEGFKSKNKNSNKNQINSKKIKEKYENNNNNEYDNSNNEYNNSNNEYNNRNNTNNDNDYDMIINSEDSKDYLDIENDKINNNTNNINNISNNNNNKKRNNFTDKELYYLKQDSRISEKAVKKIDSLFNENNKELFYDIPIPSSTTPTSSPTSTPTSTSTNTLDKHKDEIKSVFSPKILIGKNNNGFGNTEKQSSWNSAFSGAEFDASFYNKYSDNDKCKGQYDTFGEDAQGNLIVKDYKYSKTFVPGYTYVPPENWSVPQQRPPVCSSSSPNTLKLTGLVDRGLPLNVLELNPQGQVADTEESVTLTNVGSMLPNFRYEEQPFSKPYV